jgi:hypothetical protein
VASSREHFADPAAEDRPEGQVVQAAAPAAEYALAAQGAHDVDMVVAV